MKVMIVDDEPDIVTYLSTWLEDQGYETCSAADGSQGMQAIISERPDLVLLDLKMPNKTGLQLYRDLRQHETFKHLPVIVITGMTEFQIYSSECEPLSEPEAYIDKPIDLQALRAAIKQVIG
jgi:CheY-like chemotaxis protein